MVQPLTHLRGVFALFLLIFFAALQVNAEPRLTWKPNRETDLEGYKVYIADFYKIYPPIDVKLKTSHSLTNLDSETTYWIYVTSYNTNGFESEPSVVLQHPTGGCNFTIYPKTAEISPWPAGGQFRVITASLCPWTAESTVDWLTITEGQSGEGMGDVHYTVAQNTTLQPRIGHIRIADQVYQVTQTAAGEPVLLADVTEHEMSLLAGDTFDVSVTTSESMDLRYQWFRDGGALPGAIDSFLTIFDLTSADEGLYSVQISSASSSITNGLVQLTVIDKPEIEESGQPQSTSVLLGGPAYLKVAAKGRLLSYAWHKDGKVTGFNTHELFIPAVTEDDFGTYYVVVTNLAGAVQSRPAQLYGGVEEQVTGKIDVVITDSDPIGFQIQGNGIPGKVYEVYSSTNLVDWRLIDLLQLDSTGRFAIRVASPSTTRQWFVRTVRRATP